MDIRKIILEEVNDFDWTEDIQPDLSVGDCITNKLDANSGELWLYNKDNREWIIDMITHTSGGTPVYRWKPLNKILEMVLLSYVVLGKNSGRKFLHQFMSSNEMVAFLHIFQ